MKNRAKLDSYILASRVQNASLQLSTRAWRSAHVAYNWLQQQRQNERLALRDLYQVTWMCQGTQSDKSNVIWVIGCCYWVLLSPVHTEWWSTVFLLSVTCRSVDLCFYTQKMKKTTMYGTNPSGSDHLVRRHDLEWEKLTRSYLENFWSNFDAILHDRLMYLAWFYKTNKRWHSWPRSLTLRVQIDCSTQFALPRSQFNK